MELLPGWNVDVERGPDWLFVRFHEVDRRWVHVDGLAEAIWALLQQQFTNRVVLEMDQLGSLSSSLLGELVRLFKRVQADGGLMRLCGLSGDNQQVLRIARLDRCFPHYPSRENAVMGVRA